MTTITTIESVAILIAALLIMLQSGAKVNPKIQFTLALVTAFISLCMVCGYSHREQMLMVFTWALITAAFMFLAAEHKNRMEDIE